MSIKAVVLLSMLPLVAGAAVSTYAEVAALVAAVEEGEVALDDAAAQIEAAPDAPLAGAALGRLYILRTREAPFSLVKYANMYRGFRALNDYIAAHGEDPLPRVWRAASAVETNYVLWSMSRTRDDLRAAGDLCRADPDLPNQTPRCKLLLGTMAKDEGDLEQALRLWAEAFEADPNGRTGREAARLLDLFTG
jgi:tetratricopeptide (TPR) repeat protein